MSRQITYCEALNEALTQEMEKDDRVVVYGIGVPDHKRIFGSTVGLEKFGSSRFFDTPLSEDALMGMGIGMAMNGLRPIYIHIRIDFLLLAINQLVNIASTVSSYSGGKLSVPLVIRAAIGRGWGQGCQHSKTVQSIFGHIPGIKVVMPVTSYDAKGMLISAIRDNNPVVFMEHRWLYWQQGDVPEESYEVPLGIPRVAREGKDITIVATSWMVVEALHAARILKETSNIEVEVIDVRSINPLDSSIIINSVNKTRRAVIADNDWIYCGFSAELASIIYTNCFGRLDCPIERIGFADIPCPTARHLENIFYPNAEVIVRTVEKMLNIKPTDLSNELFFSHENKFKGPF